MAVSGPTPWTEAYFRFHQGHFDLVRFPGEIGNVTGGSSSFSEFEWTRESTFSPTFARENKITSSFAKSNKTASLDSRERPSIR